MSETHTVAIVGINKASAEIMSSLSGCDNVKVVKVLNPELEDIRELEAFNDLTIIINAANDKDLATRLQQLELPHVDVISGLSARILFAAGNDGIPSLWSREYRTSILDSLHELHQTMHVAKDKEQLLRMVLNIAIQSTLADSGSIMLIDPKRRTLRIEMADGLDRTVVESTVQRLGRGIAGKVVRTRKPLLINGPADHGSSEAQTDRIDVVSSVCCPLIVGEEAIGVLNVNSKNPRRLFTEDDLKYLSRLTEFISDVIWTSQEHQALARSAFFFSFVNNVRDILNMEFPFLERLSLVLMKIVNSFGGDVCRYYEFHRDTNEFIARASSHLDQNILKGRPVRLNDRLTRFVLDSGKTNCLKLSVRRGDKTIQHIALPIRYEGQTRELLILQLQAARDLGLEELDVMRKVCELLSRDYKVRSESKDSRIQSIKASVISELAFDMASAKTLAGLTKLTCANACLILEAKTCVMRLFAYQAGDTESVEVFSPTGAHPTKEIERLDRAVIADVLASRRPLWIEDLRNSKFRVARPCAKSVLSAFFLSRNKVVGTLSLYDKQQVDTEDSVLFSKMDRDVFLSFCLHTLKGLQRFL